MVMNYLVIVGTHFLLLVLLQFHPLMVICVVMMRLVVGRRYVWWDSEIFWRLYLCSASACLSMEEQAESLHHVAGAQGGRELRN